MPVNRKTDMQTDRERDRLVTHE